MNAKQRTAWVLLAVGVPLSLAAIFLPDMVHLMRDEQGWRARGDAFDYLDRHPHGSYRRLALAQLEGEQRRNGLVARLIHSRYGEAWASGSQSVSAAWRADGREILTGSGSIAMRWDATSGALLDRFGPATRRAADDPQRWGFGLSQVAWGQDGAIPLAMSSGPPSLWIFEATGLTRIKLGEAPLDAFSARGGRLAWIRNLEYGATLELAGGTPVRLPHEEVTAIALAAEGRTVTASRTLIQWWQGGAKRESQRIKATANPVGFSSDAGLVLVPAGRGVELFSAASGEKQVLAHDTEVGAVCATDEYIATGTRDGQVHMWSRADYSKVRSFRSSVGGIDLLACAPRRLAVFGDDRSDARIWDVAGRPQPGEPQEAAPPRMPWVALKGADIDFPGRFPVLADWLDAAATENAKYWAIGALTVVLLLASLMLHSARSR
ncbi:MAG: WD40 repeat domain-containing protein [Burkholderiales bacterium]